MKKLIIYILVFLVVVFVLVIGISSYVTLIASPNILSADQIKDIQDVDCVLILGAGIWGNKPSPMLEDRLLQGIELYNNGIADKIIVSGDHGREEYDEVNIMKQFAIEHGVKSEDIFMDHAGFSTYESMYRAKAIFGVKKLIVVTQKYHLYRSIYIGKALGMDTYGVASDPRKYVGHVYREMREILARNKDFINCILKPKPTYLGETIPVNGNGDVTND